MADEQQDQQQQVSNGSDTQQVQQPVDVLSPEARRILKKEREEARSAERKRVEEEYGVPAKEARRIIAESKQREESQQTEVEKTRKQVQEVERERDSVKEELEAAYAHVARMTQETTLREAFSEAGLNPKRMKIALRSADMDLVEVDGDGNVSGVKDAVEAIKEDSPEWFEGDPPANPRETPPGKQTQTTRGESAASDWVGRRMKTAR